MSRPANFLFSSFVVGLACFICQNSRGDDAIEKGVRGVATHAKGKVTIDGDLSEFRGAFCTPVGYFEQDPKNQAAQFFYMWDDEAFYAGLRTLDEKQANPAPDDLLWEGDGVEWYFDTRRGDDFRGERWGDGAVHMYWRIQLKRGRAPLSCGANHHCAQSSEAWRAIMGPVEQLGASRAVAPMYSAWCGRPIRMPEPCWSRGCATRRSN